MLDYNRVLNSRWFVGLHSDIILQSFEVVRSSDQSILKRYYPLCVVAVAGFKPTEFLGVMVGGGIELEEDEHLGVVRISVEYGFRLSKGWEFPLGITYDIKLNGYSSMVLGVGFA